MNEKEFIKEYKKYCDIELSDIESNKLKGMPFPGATVNIFWTHWEKDMYDEGYLFLLPFSDADIDDYFIHIPRPENPGGKDAAEPEWIHINKLLKNEYCKEIIIVSNNRVKELEKALLELVNWAKPDSIGKWNYERAIEVAQQLLTNKSK